jgi:PE family
VADELRFHPPSLRDAGQGLSDVGDRLGAEWQALVAMAEGMGDIFGDDDVGSLIAATYQAAQQIAAEAYGSAAQGFGDFGGGLTDMAATYEQTEQTTTEDVQDVGGAV